MSETTRKKAHEAAEAIRETGQSAAQDVRDAAGAAAQAARETARSARDAAGEAVDHARHSAADQGERVAAAMRSHADEMEADSVKRRVLDSVAGGVDTLSDRVRDGNLGQMLNDAENFARRNPLLFIAGAALAGFAIARMTQSRGHRDEAL